MAKKEEQKIRIRAKYKDLDLLPECVIKYDKGRLKMEIEGITASAIIEIWVDKYDLDYAWREVKHD